MGGAKDDPGITETGNDESPGAVLSPANISVLSKCSGLRLCWGIIPGIVPVPVLVPAIIILLLFDLFVNLSELLRS
jgi:hypothetical protein